LKLTFSKFGTKKPRNNKKKGNIFNIHDDAWGPQKYIRSQGALKYTLNGS
jgi:hypothetical protein